MAPNCGQKDYNITPLSPSKRRASRRLMAQKRRLNRDMCATRTVELPSTKKLGEEKHKLLFMLSLGLIPNYKKTIQPTPYVFLNKLDHQAYLKAQAKTEERIKKILEKQLLDEILQPRNQISVPDPRPLKLVPLRLIPEFEEAHVSPEDVEVIDLISDEEDNNLNPTSFTDLSSSSAPEPEEVIIDLASSDDEDDRLNNRETIDFVNFHTAPKTRRASSRKSNASRRTSPRFS